MANSKVKTLWTTSGRVLDSREVLDSNGGLRVGRVDIPESMMVTVEGYSKIEYQRTDSQGNVSKYDSIMEALTLYGKEPIIETKTGSGVMTFFVDGSDSTYAGFVHIDVYKEWETDVDPDPETEDPIDGAIRNWGIQRAGDRIFTWEKYNSSQGYWASFGHWHDSWADTLVNSFNKMKPAKLDDIKVALGIEVSGGGGAPAWERRVSTLENEMKSVQSRLDALEALNKKD
ncbi:MAG: hypothetical protein [Caudoviricetes sp.]|nr:MAG: hypothetical protein [Caudoviricetes sp.]